MGVAELVAEEVRSRTRRRKTLTLLKRPVAVLTTASVAVYESVVQIINELLPLRSTKIIACSVLLYSLMHFVSMPNTFLALSLKRSDFALRYAAWWFLLGFVSSVGFGSGVQTGALFLFPHVVKITLAAQECGSMSFESDEMWLSRSELSFQCMDTIIDSSSASPTYVGFWDPFARSLPAAILCGLGAAVGEVPPYILSKSVAASGGCTDSVFDAILDGTSDDQDDAGDTETLAQGADKLFTQSKDKVESFLRGGFWSIFFLALVPNAMFDVAGVLCGQLGVPLNIFLGAVTSAKVIRTPLQAAFTILIVSERSTSVFLHFLEGLPDMLVTPATVSSLRTNLDGLRANLVGSTAASSASAAAKTSGVASALGFLQTAMGWLSFGVFVIFLGRSLEEIAKVRTSIQDDREIEQMRTAAAATATKAPSSFPESNPARVASSIQQQDAR